jgi:hypothetical protein
MRLFIAGYANVVLAGYVVAVEVVEAWRWLNANQTAFARALKYWTARPFHFSVYLLLSYLALSLGFFLGGGLGVIVGLVVVVASFLFGQIAFLGVQEIIDRNDIAKSHRPELAHHVSQAKAWLASSADGENTAMLSYAALELRLAVERLAVHYWRTLLDRKVEAQDLDDVRKFDRIQQRIYELSGHQKAIDGAFEFMRILLRACKIDQPLRTPDIGRLANYWHTCSELCHIEGALGLAAPEFRKAHFAALSEVCEALVAHVSSLGWPMLTEPTFVELRNRFMAGTASSDDVLTHVAKTGLHALAEFTDGRPVHIVGQPVPSRATKETA